MRISREGAETARGRERENLKYRGCTASAEPDMGLEPTVKPTNREIMT